MEPPARTQLDLVCAGVAVWKDGQLVLRNELFRRLLGESWLAEKDRVRPISEPLRVFRDRGEDERYLLALIRFGRQVDELLRLKCKFVLGCVPPF